MFETVRQMTGLPESAFTGTISTGGTWELDFTLHPPTIEGGSVRRQTLSLLGTAFSFVHLLGLISRRTKCSSNCPRVRA